MNMARKKIKLRHKEVRVEDQWNSVLSMNGF